MPGCPTPPQSAAFGRAVVFGACGFLGRELVRLLLDSGARVLGVDTRPWPGALPEGYAHEAGGEAALGQAAAFLRQGRAGLAGCSGSCSAGQGGLPPGPPLGEEGYDCAGAAQDAGRAGLAAFFHMAGLADAGACQKNPELARRLNVDLVAEALAALSGVACAFVFPSTGIVYGDALGRPAREDDPLLPAAQYARGKIEAEGLVRAACHAGPLRGAIARLSNLYGPGGGENTVLGRVLAQVRRGEPLRVWDESPVRDFLHVADAAEGLLRLGLAANALVPGSLASGPLAEGGCLTANLSTGAGTRIGALLDLAAELFHTSRLPQEREPDPAARVSSLVLDNARLTALTGWRPGIGLAQGLHGCL